MFGEKKIYGTKVGMGLSGISALHLFENGFNRDRNYFLRIDGQQLILYRGIVKKPKRQTIHENSLANLRNRKKSEGMSSQVRRKIMKNIHNWFTAIEYAKGTGKEDNFSVKKHLGIVTLTLPTTQMHDDRELKRYGLMMFIKDLKKISGTLNYLWKAESQKNGNIHFHIIIDEYIEMKKIQELWYRRLSSLGYMQQYYKNTGKNNPPATNVESLRDVTSSGAYVAKYVGKDEGERVIEGRLWGCSDTIRDLNTAEIQIQHEDLESVFNIINTAIASAYIREYCVILKDVQNIEELFHYATSNYYFDSCINRNVANIYAYEHKGFWGSCLTEWEHDVIQDMGKITARYLFDNDMIDY